MSYCKKIVGVICVRVAVCLEYAGMEALESQLSVRFSAISQLSENVTVPAQF